MRHFKKGLATFALTTAVLVPAGLAGAARWARAGLGPLALAGVVVAAVILAARSPRSAERSAT